MPISACRTWPVAAPRWVACTRFGVAVAVLTALLYCLPLLYVVTVVLLLALLKRHGRHRVRVVPAGTLYFVSQGRWKLDPGVCAPGRELVLARVWLTSGWVTMRLSGGAGPESKDTMLQVTIWKATVTSCAWRQLRLRMADCIARPEPAVARVGR